MSIQFTGDVQLERSITGLFAGCTSFSMFFYFRWDGTVNDANGNFNIISTNWAQYIQFNVATVDQTQFPGQVQVNLIITDSQGNWVATLPGGVKIAVGQVYSIAVSYAPGACTLYVNAFPYSMSPNPSHPVATSDWYFYAGYSGVVRNTETGNSGNPAAPAAFQYTMRDLALWYNHAITSTDAANLTQAIKTPATLASPATYYWPMTGTQGTTPGTVTEYNGNTAYNLIAKNGGQSYSTIKYADAMAWVPAVHAVGQVTPLGTGCIIWLETTNTSEWSEETEYVVNPTITITGSQGGTFQLNDAIIRSGNGWDYKGQFFPFPSGYAVTSSSDTVTMSAPLGWALTVAGSAAAESGTTLENRFGKSINDCETQPTKMKLGYDCTWDYPQFAFRNLALSFTSGGGNVSSFLPVQTMPWTMPSSDNNGNTLSASNPYWVPVVDPSGDFLFDTTPSDPVYDGLWCISWDDYGDAVNHPFIGGAALVNDAATVFMGTEQVAMRNTGTYDAGKNAYLGCARVYQITLPDHANHYRLAWTAWQDQRVINVKNIQVLGPGDFTYTDTSTVVTPPAYNNLAYSSRFQNLVGTNGGSLRSVDNTWAENMISKKQFKNVNDLYWVQGGRTTEATPSALTYTPITTPLYVYGGTFGPDGETYTATLASNIDNAQTTITISDADTAPVMTGSVLWIDSERMYVTNVVGTTVTVTRGSVGTTAASHNAGSITVGYRHQITDISQLGIGFVGQPWTGWTVTFNGRHNLEWGLQPDFNGSWPNATFSDGFSTQPVQDYPIITGPTTCILWQQAFDSSSSSPNAFLTVSGTTTLPANCTMSWFWPCQTIQSTGTTYPIEFVAAATQWQTGGRVVFTFVPWMTDQGAYDAAQIFLANMKVGSSLILECDNEPWNPGYVTHCILDMCDIWFNKTGIHPEWRYYWLVMRSYQIWKIFHDVFSAAGRGSEIRVWLNCQRPDVGGASQFLAQAVAKNAPFTDLAFAPYYGVGEQLDGSGNLARVKLLSTEAMLDMVSFITWYSRDYANINSPYVEAQEWGTLCSNFNANVGGVNPHGWTVNPCIYEINFDGLHDATFFHPTQNIASGSGGDSISFTVSSVNNLAVGEYIVVGYGGNNWPQFVSTTEVMKITGVSGSTLTCTRGINGTPTPAHASGVGCRDMMYEINRDLVHHPQAYRVWYEVLSTYDRAGVVDAMMMGTTVESISQVWGTVQHQQTMGYGDGRAGSNDNSKNILRYGSANTKAKDWPYWAGDGTTGHLDSVMARAVRDYNDGVYALGGYTPPTPPPTPGLKWRPRPFFVTHKRR